MSSSIPPTVLPNDALLGLEGEELDRALRAHRRATVGDQRSWASRQLHRLNEISAGAGATAAAAAVSAGFLLVAVLSARPTRWLNAFQALAAAVTVVMVFAVQHTQVRQQAALQRKVDELLRVLPGADVRLMHVETAAQAELDELNERHESVRNEAIIDTHHGGGDVDGGEGVDAGRDAGTAS